MKKIIFIAAALMFISGCSDNNSSDPENKAGNICVFNGLGDVGTLSVVDEAGNISNDVLSVGKWPNHITEYNRKLFIVNSGNNNVQMIDAETDENLGSIELPAFSNPMRSAVSCGKLYATNSFGSGISVYSFDNDSLYNIPVTGLPSGSMNGGTDAIISFGNKVYAGVKNVTYNPDWTANYGEEYIVVIDAQTDSIICSFAAGVNIADMLIDNENELHVLSTGNRSDVNGFVKIFNLNNYELTHRVDLGSQPSSFTMNSEGMIYAAVSGLNPDWTGFGGIMKYNSATNLILNGSDDLIYSSSESGIMDICADGYGKIYAPLFNKNQLVILENDFVDTILTTGNGPQGLIFVRDSE